MIPTVEQLKTTLAGLPTADRAELAHYLLVSLDEQADSDAPQASDMAEWRAELDRRVAEIHSGKAVGIPLETVVAELREHFP